MTKRTRRHLYSVDRALTLLNGGDRPASIPDDELTREIMRLRSHYGEVTFSDRVEAIEAWLWVEAPSTPAGRKAKWDKGNVLYAWLAVEKEIAASLARGGPAEVKTVIDNRFRRDNGRPWHIGGDLVIKTATTARRLYADGKKLLAEIHPAQRRVWERLAVERK